MPAVFMTQDFAECEPKSKSDKIHRHPPPYLCADQKKAKVIIAFMPFLGLTMEIWMAARVIPALFSCLKRTTLTFHIAHIRYTYTFVV